MTKSKSALRLILAGSIAALIAAPAAQAATYYYDGTTVGGTGDGISQGGATGVWDTSTLNWDQGSGLARIAWPNDTTLGNTDTAIFGGTAGTVTLGADITVGGLTFNTTGYILASDDGLKTLSFGPGDNTILFNNIAAASTSSGATAGLKLGGTGNVILSTSNPVTAGTLTLQYAVAGDFSTGWSGSTTINAGRTLALNGRDLSLSSTSGITLNGGGITLINTNSTQGAFDRVASVGITANSGTFTYSNTDLTATYAETIGTVTLNRGQMNFVLGGDMSTGSQTLTVGVVGVGLAKTGTSVVTFSNALTALNSSVAAGTDVIRVNGITTSTPANQIIGPWATVGTAAGTQNNFARYVSDGAFGYVVAAALTDTAFASWANSTTDTWSYNTGSANTINTTYQAAAVRFYGATSVLTLGTGNLETNGLFFSGANAKTVASTGGALTTPAGGGNLYVTSGQANHTISAPINNNGGAVTLVVSGAGRTLTLSSTTSNYSGGTVLNSGTLVTTSNANLGIGGGVTVNGIASWNASTGTNRSITINEGGVLTMTGASSQIYSGLLSGSGALASNTNNVYYFTNTGNSLSGEVTVSYGMFFGNITDSSKTINIGTTNGNGGFGWTGGAKTLAQRVFALNAAGGGFITSNGGALVIEQDLAITGAAGARTLNLQGNNTAINTFSGDIANGTSGGASVVSLTKAGTGTWALGGTNTYTGDTNLLAVSGSRLVFQGSQALSASTTLKFTQTSSSVANVRFLDDGAGTINFNRPIEFGGSNTSQQLSIFVGNNNTANGGSSAGATTGSTIQVGNITHTSLAADTGSLSINATGANGYRLRTGTITLNNLTIRTAADTTTTILNPTSANMTVDAITMAAGNVTASDGIPVVRLAGTSSDNIVTGVISNATDFATGHVLSLQKQGTSTWTLQGTNTYTGTTAISVGKLLLSSTGSLDGGSAVTVSGGALGGTGTVNGTVTVSSTGGIDLRDNAVGNLTLASTLDITGAAGANNLSFDLGNGTGTSDSILAAGTTSVTTSGAAVINLNQLNGVAGRTATTYTLIGGAGTLDATNFANFTLATTAAFGQTYGLVHDLVSDGGTGNLQVSATNVTSATAAAFWAGSTDVNWSSATNWRDTVAGDGAVAGAPDYQTNVTFSTTTPGPLLLTTNVLDVDFDINSLTFTDASGNVTIGGTTKMLTIEAAAVNGNALGNGIDSQKTTGTNTISAKVALASSQTWTVASGGTLAVSGVVSDFGGGNSLTKAGLGSLNLSGANTYSGATNITAGILRLDTAAASLANTSSIDITSGASLFLRSVTSAIFGAGQSLTLNGTGATGSGALVVSTAGTTTWNGPVSLGSDSLVLQGGGTTLNIGGAVSLAANTLTVQADGSNSATISGAISGSGGLTKTGTSTLILSGANTYTGTTAVNAGTLSLAPTGNFLGGVLLASSAVTINQGATLQFSPTVAAKADSSGYSLASPITLTGGAGTATMRFVGNDFKYVLSGGVTGQSSVAQTLALIQGGAVTTGDRQDIVVSGALADGASGGTLAVTVDFAGTSGVGQNAFVNLTGQSTFTGNLIVNNSRLMNAGSLYPGAWLTIGGERWVGFSIAPGSAETVGTGSLGGGGVYNGNITINTGNGTSGTGITTLSFLSSANQTLGGTISGAGNLRQDGTNTLTLTGSNTYTGTTTVSSGTLAVSNIDVVANNNALGKSSSAAANLILRGGTLQYTTGGAASTDRNFALLSSSTINASGAGALNFSQTGDISPDVTGLTFNAAGTNRVISNLGSTANLVVGMSITGTGIAAGSTIASIDSATQVTLASSANVTIGTGVSAAFGYGSRTLTLTGTNTGANTIAGNLVNSTAGSGVLSVTKSGTGTWVLSGTNTYTGVTNVNGGKLNLNGILGAGANVVNANAGVTNFGVSQTLAALNIADGAVATLGDPAAAAAAFGGEEMFAPQGEIMAGGATQVVPEPGSAALLLSGLATLLGLRRRKA